MSTGDVSWGARPDPATGPRRRRAELLNGSIGGIGRAQRVDAVRASFAGVRPGRPCSSDASFSTMTHDQITRLPDGRVIATFDKSPSNSSGRRPDRFTT